MGHRWPLLRQVDTDFFLPPRVLNPLLTAVLQKAEQRLFVRQKVERQQLNPCQPVAFAYLSAIGGKSVSH